MPSSSIRSLAVAGLFSSTVAILLTAQSPTGTTTPQDPAQQPPKFRVETNFVRVDAYPTRDGKPVLDLKAEDFEVFEDGVAQRLESFEHVVVRPAGAQDDRIEVSSQRESYQAAANPRNRVFVIFLDTPHVSFGSMHAINEPLIRLIDRILGPDDLVGVMTPKMSASQMVLGRKTQVIEENLRHRWPWARRDIGIPEEDDPFGDCYGAVKSGGEAQEMLLRKRERATLEALEDLVRYLRTIREERKAILTITEGWLLYGENMALLDQRTSPSGAPGSVPGLDPIGVGPNGKLTNRDPRRTPDGVLSNSQCAGERLRLATMDNKQFFKDLMDQANAGNASFYPVDPRGLAVFDKPLGFSEPLPISVDIAMLKERIEVLRTLADNTDGLAVVNSNDLDKGLRRISDDLTSYYLLGYLSTNSKLDGRFRSLKVKVKRPGIDVRARRGYRAATEAEVATARRAADAPVPDATRAVNMAIERIARVRPDARFVINAINTGTPKPTVWIAGELLPLSGRPDAFAQGATADIEAVFGTSSTTGRAVLKPGERSFLISVPSSATADKVTIRARLTPTSGDAIPLTDAIQLQPAEFQALLYRRGVTTGNRLVPAADFRFSRTERVRLELPVDATVTPGAGRLLDKAGQPLQVPVVVGERVDAASGQRWITADVTLAALSNGDYAIEVEIAEATRSQRIVTGIRVNR